MGDRPRVCMICANFRPAVGGAEKQAEALARAIVAEGGEAFVLTQRVKGLPRREAMDGLAVCREIHAPARETVERRCAASLVVRRYLELYRGLRGASAV